MSIKTKIAAVALAALTVTAGVASATSSAQAKPLGWAIGAGIATAAIVGTAVAASNQPYYYGGYHHCGWSPRYNAFGQYVGSIRTCY
ncbi:hypothetical protein JJC00_36035 [Bradyrhizobium diazoefficiens]|uniref:hypothetical protein n=1 Tax=Bradyrhizobium diazoefficiens TaxID=1355477 RepID=UPI00190A4774|nr:hypothetical protein [Bradyrhizobium diazoefficiens]QQO33839.1 hypothetical protein JJC00_36035 [Bradyrhizobium diazoefficiens]